MMQNEHVRAIREELQEGDETGPADPFADAPAVIELRNVELSFDQPILKGVDIAVRKGETFLVVGESGTGKSTILKLIMRQLMADSGEVCVFGHRMSELSFSEAQELRRRIGMVFQHNALFDSLTVFDNVAYPLRENTDYDEDRIMDVVRERIEFMDLDPDQVMHQMPSELSGGMKKRVGIARAIATDPEVVLYDEPTAGLDPLTVGTINKLVKKLQQELGVTSILVSHDIRAGFRVANRVALLKDGEIQFDGTPEEMVAADDPYINAFLS